MKISFGFLLCFLLVGVSAGGIRGAFERMFIWYAYQANIAVLKMDDGITSDTEAIDVKKLQICPGKTGSGKHGTLNFKEFISFTNQGSKGKSQTNPNTGKFDYPTNPDLTAKTLMDNRAVGDKWFNTKSITPLANNYNQLMPEISKLVYQFKGELPDNDAIMRNALNSVEKIKQTREVDYEKYRIPALKASPDFADVKEWATFRYVLGGKSSSQTEYLDLEFTAEKNNIDVGTFKKRVSVWEQNVFFQDSDPGFNKQTKGQNARGHKGSLKSSTQGVNLANTGCP